MRWIQRFRVLWGARAFHLLHGWMATCLAVGQTVEVTTRFFQEDCHFSAFGGNRYTWLDPGMRLVLRGSDAGQALELTITVRNQIQPVQLNGDNSPTRWIQARVVESRETIDGELDSVSIDYFARCGETGDVYYLGEKVENYEGNEVASTFGSWMAGERGAEFGILMPGSFYLGARYQQYFVPGLAMEHAEHDAMGLSVETPFGTFENCVRIKEQNAIRSEAEPSFKTYAPGIGLIVDDEFELAEIHLGVEGLPAECRWKPFSSHPYFPLIPNSQFEFSHSTNPNRFSIQVLPDMENFTVTVGETEQVISTRVVEEVEFLGEIQLSVVRKWYAQCLETGDVYLFGQKVLFSEGDVPSAETSDWSSEEKGRVPVLILPGRILPGAQFPGAFVDATEFSIAQFDSAFVTADVPYGPLNHSVTVMERHYQGEVDRVETMTYAPVLGLVRLANGFELNAVSGLPSPYGHPLLLIEETVTVSWPSSEMLFQLEGSSDLQRWVPVIAPSFAPNELNRFTLLKSEAFKFFRLIAP